MVSWKQIPVDIREIHLASVLRCGQSFRWKNIDQVWSLAYKGRVLLVKQDDKTLYYSSIPEDKDDTLQIIRDYLNLDVKVVNLYKDWGERDPHFQKRTVSFSGVRVLRQDPWENLCSFI